MEVADRQLDIMGYTDHSVRHASIVSKRIADILRTTGCPQREIELGQIAGFLHDIGNSVNREEHPQSGALLAYQVLTKKGMDVEEAAQIMTAIGNHDEQTGKPVSNITAALIISDKSDVHRSRVRHMDRKLVEMLDIHDRVNYGVIDNTLAVDTEKKEIFFALDVDEEISSMMDYFDIFLERMRMCKSAARFLKYEFRMSVNGHRLV